jgi:hypothetical protein
VDSGTGGLLLGEHIPDLGWNCPMEGEQMSMERDWKAEKKDLQVAYDIVQDHLVKAEQRLRDKDKLITELADALEVSASHDTDWARQSNHLEIVQRAREAT